MLIAITVIRIMLEHATNTDAKLVSSLQQQEMLVLYVLLIVKHAQLETLVTHVMMVITRVAQHAHHVMILKNVYVELMLH